MENSERHMLMSLVASIMWDSLSASIVSLAQQHSSSRAWSTRCMKGLVHQTLIDISGKVSLTHRCDT